MFTNHQMISSKTMQKYLTSLQIKFFLKENKIRPLNPRKVKKKQKKRLNFINKIKSNLNKNIK